MLPLFSFFFNDTATTEIYTLSLHDALPICGAASRSRGVPGNADGVGVLAIVSWIAASIALRGCVAGAWSSKSSERAPSGASLMFTVTGVGKLRAAGRAWTALVSCWA